jgi:hypothetical protein
MMHELGIVFVAAGATLVVVFGGLWGREALARRRPCDDVFNYIERPRAVRRMPADPPRRAGASALSDPPPRFPARRWAVCAARARMPRRQRGRLQPVPHAGRVPCRHATLSASPRGIGEPNPTYEAPCDALLAALRLHHLDEPHRHRAPVEWLRQDHPGARAPSREIQYAQCRAFDGQVYR